MKALQQIGLCIVAVTVMTTSPQALSIGHKVILKPLDPTLQLKEEAKKILSTFAMVERRPRSYHDRHVHHGSNGDSIAKAGYRIFTDVYSKNRNHSRVQTLINVDASIFNRRKNGVEFLANAYANGRFKSVQGRFRVNGKDVFTSYKFGLDARNTNINYSRFISKEIGRSKQSFKVGFISVTVSLGIDGVLKPNFQALAVNPKPYLKTNEWVKVEHSNRASLYGDASASIGNRFASAGVRGNLKLIGVYTPVTVKLAHMGSGNIYSNRADMGLCTLNGSLNVWAKVFRKKFNKTLVKRAGVCFNRRLHNVNKFIGY